ncbi:MAG TPA: ribosome small subunit-dependent GTPase A [Candidatus Limnocylindrales bacterium]|nr:ribosome small subunit-dependent GTPase A [Candidatus Limnocylindrales bacterium]
MRPLPGADGPRELISLGWDASHAAAWSGLSDEAGRALEPGRLTSGERGAFAVALATGDVQATLSGRLRHETELDPEALHPSVGDWVAVAADGAGSAIIHAVLPRRSALVRRGPVDGSARNQVLAANVDVAFLVTSLNAEFNVRRLERYVAVAWESGALPVVLLSKADVAVDADGMCLAAEATAPGVEVIAVSAYTGAGLAAVRRHLGPGRTVVFLGSSGVGKSSLVNALAGSDVMATAAIRPDDARGRHTTTRRQLVRLDAGLVIDTPGLRELSLADGDGLTDAFVDIEAIAAGCRFRDCSHSVEPGCAIRTALGTGELDPERWAAFRKLELEAHRAELAGNAVARKAERRRWTAMIRGVERHMEMKYGGER